MISIYLRNKLLDKIFGGTNFTFNVYVSLHTASPGTTGANEVTGGSYARVLITQWSSASSASLTNETSVLFASMPATTVTHVGVWDASTSGNFGMGGPLDSSVVVGSGQSVALTVGEVTVAMEAGSL